MLSGQVRKNFVEGCKYEPLAYGEAEQGGVGDLVVSMESFAERLRQGLPVGGDGLVAVAGLLLEAPEHRCDLLHAELAGLWSGEEPQDADLSQGAERPLEAGCLEPLVRRAVVDVIRIEQSYSHVDVQQIDRPSQDCLRRGPSPCVASRPGLFWP